MNSGTEHPLVIGYGNTLRSDDGVGPVVAHRLAERGWPAIEVHQLTPELAEPIADASTVIFIDADASLAPGEFRCEPLTAQAAGPDTHQVSPAGLLQLARQVYGRAPDACLISVGVESFEFGQNLSNSVEATVERIVKRIETDLSAITSRNPES